MNDDIAIFGARLFSLSVPVFVLASALAIFAYDRAEARARQVGDVRWLLASLVLAALSTWVIELHPADGFRGMGWLVTRAVLGAAAVGLAEAAGTLLSRGFSARLASRGTIFSALRWLRPDAARSPRSLAAWPPPSASVWRPRRAS